MITRAKKHVLIVEDSPDLQVLLGQLFKKAGYTVSQAFDGKQALALLKALPQPPSFILLDLMMPVMDGIEFRQIQLRDPLLADIPVVIMTADTEPAARAAQLGVIHYFAKPIHSIDTLIQVADKYSNE